MITTRNSRRGLILCTALTLLLAWPVSGFAQEATLSGTITDSTGGVLPGVTVTAKHTSTGNTFEAVTDERGFFRSPVRTGTYNVTAALEGFGTVTRTMELLVGQTAVANLQMAPAAVREAVQVTAEAPLIDVTSSTLGSNVDPRQMRELPLNGRNFVDLTMLAPGSRQNASADELGGLGTFQLNVDGLRVTQNQTAGFGQPKYSRDAIAEFEFVANRFDATQGGSTGTMVNAITKSGTNTPAGTFSGYFRDDNFIAKDFVQKRVLPYADQQLSWTFGGPILMNRAHFFVNYEYEREPQTFSHSSPYPSFNFDHQGTRMEKKGGGRLDFQFNPQTHMTVRGNKSIVDMPYDARYTGGVDAPSVVGDHDDSAQHRPRAWRSRRCSARARSTRSAPAMPGTTGSRTRFFRGPDHPYPGLELRHADHPVARLHHRTGAQQFARRRAAGYLHGSRQLPDVVLEGRAPRPEGRRRVRLPAEPGVPLQPLHGHLRRAGRRDPVEHRAAVPGVERHLHLEPGRDLAHVRTYTLGVGQMKPTRR